MNKALSRIGATLVLFGAAFGVFGQIIKSGNGYLFRYKLVTGKRLTYRMVTKAMMSGQAAKTPAPNIEILMSQFVQSVRNDVATVTVSSSMKMNGKPIGNPNSVVGQMDTMGRQLGEGQSGRDMSVTFPKDPVKPGSKWTVDFPMSNGKLKGAYTFLGISGSGKNQVAKLKIDLSSANQGTQLTGSGQFLMLMADGFPLSATIKLKVSSQGKSGPFSGVTTITMTRI